jgi:hypothetical protein
MACNAARKLTCQRRAGSISRCGNWAGLQRSVLLKEPFRMAESPGVV